jgi:hypothetical protein
MTNVMHKFLSMYLFLFLTLSMYLLLFLTLYMFRVHCAHHQERDIVNTTSGNCHSMLVAMSCAGWE